MAEVWLVTVERERLSGGDVQNGLEGKLSGKTFLLDDTLHHGYALFMRFLSEGASGLSISRSHPDKLHSLYGFSCKTYWLSQIGKEDCIDPSSLSFLCHTIIEFMKESTRPVIILDGLEYLVTQTDFITVLKHLHIINDYAKIYDAILILPVESAAFEGKELSILEREFGLLEKVK